MSHDATDQHRLAITIRGAVQGVGFRPFVYRLATELGLTGWVANTPLGVAVEVQGRRRLLEEFALRVERERPPRASIQGLELSFLDPAAFSGFSIRESQHGGARSAQVVPDIATCADCVRELFDPADRRHRYPFINCTNCGPRFSIIERLPYDRPHTTMRGFTMCARCRAEYHDPRDRRFHAQPNACPACGPQLALWGPGGEVLARREDALREAAAAVRAGRVVAVKGLGGFHLVVDARDDAAVARLREGKRREEKPFAVMLPALADVEAACEVGPLEARLLRSAEAPIVLLRRRAAAAGAAIVPGVAPGNPRLGVMLPYTPLHHLLMRELGSPVVASSANISDEPICTDEREALVRLAGIADGFLIHDRPILRHVDDSIVRVSMNREMVLRRARGYAPAPVPVSGPAAPVLAVGGHLKNTVALCTSGNVYVSQHIGDLDTHLSYDAFQRVIAAFLDLYGVRPGAVACDLHPDYVSTGHANRSGLPVVGVQHHHAHVVACMAENQLDGRVLGVAWDGSGFGPDGTIWGGEFLLATPAGFERAATFRSFRLPGGSRAIREPCRTALGVLHELGIDANAHADLAPLRALPEPARGVLLRMLARAVNSPLTTSAGRLFDAVAALAGLVQVSRFEGQAAMALEFALDGAAAAPPYPMALVARDGDPRLIVDWGPLVHAVLADVRAGVPAAVISARFHEALADAIVRVAERAGEPRVVLSGGCFQNAHLTERAVARLGAAGFRAYWHQRIPPNDGGVALGQAVVAAYRAAAREESGR